MSINMSINNLLRGFIIVMMALIIYCWFLYPGMFPNKVNATCNNLLNCANEGIAWVLQLLENSKKNAESYRSCQYQVEFDGKIQPQNCWQKPVTPDDLVFANPFRWPYSGTCCPNYDLEVSTGIEMSDNFGEINLNSLVQETDHDPQTV